MLKSRILLLEDDITLNETVSEYLEELGYRVDVVEDGEEALGLMYENSYDIFLLDVKVPTLNGFDLLKEARGRGIQTPAIFITSLNSVDDLSQGYESGCDDYIRKPFVLKELKIRVETLLKRGFFHSSKNLIEISEDIQYDSKNNELIIDNESISLGNKESLLLKFFMKNEGEVLAHERIYEHLWNYDEEPSDTALRTYIKNLRKIIGKECIVSIKKQGYKFVTTK